MNSDFMLTAEERRLKQLKRRRIFIASAAWVVVIVTGIFAGRPALNAIKAWQARRHASKAFAYMEKENWLEARKEATAAYQLRPTEPQSVRAVARFLSRTRQPDALEFWHQLEKLTPLTREDRQDEAAIAIVSGETARADIAVQALLKSKGADPVGWLLAAQLAIQKGQADDAMSALAKIFNNAQSTEQEQLQAALLELALTSGSEGIDERATDAWSRIEKISQGKSATGLDALVLLARRELSNQKSQVTSQKSEENLDLPTPSSKLPAPGSELAERLASHPLAKAPQKLLSLDLLEHADPSKRDELIGQGIEQFKNGNAKDLLALATWLNEKKEFEKTLEAIPLERALLGRELFLQYLDALGGLERWSEIKQLLLGDRYPLDPVIQKMYLARCNAQLGEKTAGENNWQRALEAAAGEPGKLLTVGEYAEKNGIFDVAKSAFENAAMQSPKLRFAQQGRLRIAQRSGDTGKIHAVLAEMLKIWPNDAAVQNDEGYTRLLLLNEQQAQVESRKDKVETGKIVEAGVSPAKPTSKPTAADTAAATAEHPAPNSQLSPGRGLYQAGGPAPSSQLPTPSSDLQALSALAEKLVEKNPRSLPHRTFLALARLKQNRAADALAVYENITVARGTLTPSALVVHAAVLAANGREDEAKSEISQIRTDQLLQEEQALIANIRQN